MSESYKTIVFVFWNLNLDCIYGDREISTQGEVNGTACAVVNQQYK